jgi:hypothetical protein
MLWFWLAWIVVFLCRAAEGFGRVTVRPGSPKAIGAVARLYI